MPFDAQAPTFDLRAGLPPAIAARVADAVIENAALGDLGDLGARGRLLEIGAGTGAIGAALAARLPGRYIGLDRSFGMLRRFRRRAGGAATMPALIQADADRRWPIAGGGVGRIGAVFLSRTAHLLDPERLAGEVVRTAGGAAVLILGRVVRPRDSVRARLRRCMRRLLAEAGVTGRDGEAAPRALAGALAGGGRAVSMRHQAVAHWTVRERPADALASWRGKPGLAGTALDPVFQRQLLDRLESWARQHFGDLAVAHEAEARYRLTIMNLDNPSEGGR